MKDTCLQRKALPPSPDNYGSSPQPAGLPPQPVMLPVDPLSLQAFKCPRPAQDPAHPTPKSGRHQNLPEQLLWKASWQPWPLQNPASGSQGTSDKSCLLAATASSAASQGGGSIWNCRTPQHSAGDGGNEHLNWLARGSKEGGGVTGQDPPRNILWPREVAHSPPPQNEHWVPWLVGFPAGPAATGSGTCMAKGLPLPFPLPLQTQI